MRLVRRRFRNFCGQLIGGRPDLMIWWTPGLPIVHIANPKCGCSTINNSLKNAQAQAHARIGSRYERVGDPHKKDDCLRQDGLPSAACTERYFISSVRNPFTRALSGFLDKVTHHDANPLPEFGYRRLDDFESYLRALADHDQINTNPHFRPQHFNLDFPRIRYDAIFFLENIAALPRYLSALCPDFQLRTFAPHSRKASSKLHAYYSSGAVGMVREIFARDFELFGYSGHLDDADTSPGEMILAGRLITSDSQGPAAHTRPETPGTAFKKALHMRRLINLRLI